MPAATDILLTAGGDLEAVNGDFAAALSDEQHVRDLLVSNPGDWREHPTAGVGAVAYLQGPDDGPTRKRLEADLRRQLTQDGLRLEGSVRWTDGGLNPTFDFTRP